MQRWGLPGYGAVNYTYSIGKHEVTAGQYTIFLNAVAKTDTYALYNMNMDTDVYSYGCGIKRYGTEGSYTYGVAPEGTCRPVNFVSWSNAIRFVNWLHNGQPAGDQGQGTTEDGSYYINGRLTDAQLMAVNRKTDATWVLPTEDEWYKAAYYDPGKPGGAGYWSYPTRSDVVPSNVLESGGRNNANYYSGLWPTGNYTIGAPYYRTEVGAFAGSASAYGTFDQGGNVWEWNEAVVTGGWGDARGLRGGAFSHSGADMSAGVRNFSYPNPASQYSHFGFRVAYLPPPVMKTLDLGGGVTMELVKIDPGTFQMGDITGVGFADERPVHQVTISKAFYIGKTEVTQAQWRAVMGTNPSQFAGDNLPVETVSWDACRSFCQTFSSLKGKVIRLPTEAEWEYACRAGSTTDYCYGNDVGPLANYAWHRSGSGGTTHEVGSRTGNSWLVNDVHGNVWEWCQDWYGPYSSEDQTDPTGPSTGTYHVRRGGSFDGDPGSLRSAFRYSTSGVDGAFLSGGLRVVMTTD